MRLEQAHHTAGTRSTPTLGPLRRLLCALLMAAVSLTAAAAPAQQSVKTGAQAGNAAKTLAGEDDSIRPFRVQFPKAALDDLRRRIAATRWPDKETVTDRSQGAQLTVMKELVRY